MKYCFSKSWLMENFGIKYVNIWKSGDLHNIENIDVWKFLGFKSAVLNIWIWYHVLTPLDRFVFYHLLRRFDFLENSISRTHTWWVLLRSCRIWTTVGSGPLRSGTRGKCTREKCTLPTILLGPVMIKNSHVTRDAICHKHHKKRLCKIIITRVKVHSGNVV